MVPVETFKAAISRAHQIGGLHAAVRALTTEVVDPSDLLRAQIVMAISALDHLVHELAVQGMLEVYDGLRPPTISYSNFQVPLSAIQVQASQLTRGEFETAIRDRHSYCSFQKPDKIADGIRLFSSVRLWEEVAQGLNTDPQTIKNELILAVERRNKIAHEADLDPTYPGQRWPISPMDSIGVVNLVSRIGNQIVLVVG
jgi:hypothetical protein